MFVEKRLESIIKKTAYAIEISKNEIDEITSYVQKEYMKLEQELNSLKGEVKVLMDSKEILENDLKAKKMQLKLVSDSSLGYSQEEIKKAYSQVDSLKIELAVKREQEQYLIRRQTELESKIRSIYLTMQNAEKMQAHVEAALGYLNGDLKNMIMQIDDIQQRKLMGIRIIKAQEEERQRVSRDIHDGPAQAMTNVILKADYCEKLLGIDQTRTAEELRKLKGVVRECLSDIRKIIYNLRPVMLDELGLIATLNRLVLSFREETGIETLFNTKGVFVDIKPEVSLTIFRIVQEAVSNIAKHSNAQNATISIDFKDSEVRLYIFDDGIGFDVNTLNNKNSDFDRGFGLHNMKERVEILSGVFELYSEQGKGTRININIPLIKEEGTCDEQNKDSNCG